MALWQFPAFLLLLGLLPLLAWLGWRQRQWQQEAAREMGYWPLPQRHGWQFGTSLLAFTVGILALAGPRWGQSVQQIETNSLQMMVLLDLSQSMLAEDAAENRLTQAKAIVNAAAAALEDGDQIGLIAFAGETRLLLPLTSAKSQLNTLLAPLQPADFAPQGTVMGPALATAVQSFPYPRAGQPIILLVSDGEEHGGEIAKLVQGIASDGILIIAVGVGTPAGASIPVQNEVNGTGGLKLDPLGQPILSQLNESFLQQVALMGNGPYLPGNSAADELPTRLQTIRQTHTGSQIVVEPIVRYQLFLSLSFLLFCSKWFLPKPNRRGRGRATVAVSLFILAGAAGCQPNELPATISQGNEAFINAHYSQAIEKYALAVEQNPQSAIPIFNLANTQYRLERYPESVTLLQNLSAKDAATLLPHAQFNLGNSYFQMGKYEAAIVAYQAALRLQPEDGAAKYNLELALEALNGSRQTTDTPDDQTQTALDSSPEAPPTPQTEKDTESGNQNDGNSEDIHFISVTTAAYLAIPQESFEPTSPRMTARKDW